MPYLDLKNERIYYALYRGRMLGGCPIILIHGAGENHLVWPAGLRRLPNASVYAIDLPGHGKSSGGGCRSVDEYVTWVTAFLNAIDARRAILIGHSMGGAIVQLFGLTHPDQAAGLVLIATGAKLRVSPKILQLSHNDLPSAVELVSSLEWGPNAPAQIVRLGKQQLLDNRPDIMYHDYLACDAFDTTARLNEIKAPTLIVSGTADQLTPPKYAAFMAERIPHARLVSVPDAGHMVQIEAETVVAYEVEQFVHENEHGPGDR